MLNISAYIEFDSYSKEVSKPFEEPPNLWSLNEDVSLWGSKDLPFLAAISGIRRDVRGAPLFEPRGLPMNFHESLADLEFDDFVGWLHLSEIHAALRHHSVDVKGLQPQVGLLLTVMRAVVDLYGDERVRLIFSVQD